MKNQEREDTLKHWLAVFDPMKFRSIYLKEEIDENFDEVPGYEVNPEDFSDIDRYLSSLNKTREVKLDGTR